MKKKRSRLTSAQIRHIANLANLSLKDEELNKFRKQLSNVFDFVDKLTEVKTTGIAETSHVTGLINQLRKDKAATENCLTQKEALQPSLKTNRGYFRVKALFKEQ